MTIRPSGISSVVAFPGQLGNNTPAPPIQIVGGQSISPTTAVDDTATDQAGHGGHHPGPGQRHRFRRDDHLRRQARQHGTATISGQRHPLHAAATGLSGTDTFTYTISTPCGTSTATVTVVVTCVTNPIALTNGSFEGPVRRHGPVGHPRRLDQPGRRLAHHRVRRGCWRSGAAATRACPRPTVSSSPSSTPPSRPRSTRTCRPCRCTVMSLVHLAPGPRGHRRHAGADRRAWRDRWRRPRTGRPRPTSPPTTPPGASTPAPTWSRPGRP